MLIVVYARVSTEEQARSGFSLPEQIRACRRRAEAIAGSETPAIVEFTDDLSGEIMERPGLQAALTLIREQKVDFFICLDPDRLARRLMHQLLITDDIERTGCHLEFVHHDYQDTAEGRLFYQMRGAITEFEKAKILERTARGRRGKIAAGGLPFIVRMYGYQFIKGAGQKSLATDVLIPDPREANWVRQIYRWCAFETMGPMAIAKRLNSLGVATKTGRGPWGHTQVGRILRNPAYATGELALNKNDHGGIAVARRLSKSQRAKKGVTLTAKPKPTDKWQYVQIEPLVDTELWQKAQDVLAGFRIGGRATGGRDKLRPLTGLGRCGLCGGSLYYLCGNKVICSTRYLHYWATDRPARSCTLPAKPRTAVEERVWQQVETWFLHPEVIREEKARLIEEHSSAESSAPQGTGGEVATLQAELQERHAELERLGELYTKGLWPAAKALPRMEEVNQQIQALQARIKELESSSALADEQEPGLLLAMLSDPEVLREVQATIRNATPERRAELIRIAVDRYEMYPSRRGQPPDVRVYPRL